MSPDGDINYFYGTNTSRKKPHSGIPTSLSTIKESMETLEALRNKLESLAKRCHNSSEAVSIPSLTYTRYRASTYTFY